MRRLVSLLVAAAAALALASCNETPTLRFDCTCQATKVSVDNSRIYSVCESPETGATGDAVSLCEKDFGADSGCECTCQRNGEC